MFSRNSENFVNANILQLLWKLKINMLIEKIIFWQTPKVYYQIWKQNNSRIGSLEMLYMTLSYHYICYHIHVVSIYKKSVIKLHPQINSSGFLKRKVPCIIMWLWSYFECYLFFFQFFVTFFLHVISSLSHFFCAILSSTTFCHFTKNIFYKKFYNQMSFLISTLFLW